MSYLKYLVNQIIENISTNMNSFYALKADKSDMDQSSMAIYVEMKFKDYRLNIYNSTEIINTTNKVNINDLIGLTVIATNEEKDFAELIFDNGWILRIDLRAEAYTEPEAMCLYGPNNFFVVWN